MSTTPEFTVLGADGFLGAALLAHLEATARPTLALGRRDRLPSTPLGHIINCVGITGDFRSRPLDAMEAHVCFVVDLLRRADFASLLYLSSTRVYLASERGDEDAPLVCLPSELDAVYNSSKIAGEAVCHAMRNDAVRIARLSNVYGEAGDPGLISLLVRDSLGDRSIALETTSPSAKDYVSLNDVVSLLPRIAIEGTHRVYNVASGLNTTVSAIVDALEATTGHRVPIRDDAQEVMFPVIDIRRARTEFGFRPRQLLGDLPRLVAGARTGTA